MARSFTVSTHKISYPSDSELNITGNLTMYCWVYLNATSTFHVFISKTVGNGIDNTPYDFRTNNNNPTTLVMIRSSATVGIGTFWQHESTGSLSINTWHHVAVTHDGASLNPTVQIYIDGETTTTTQTHADDAAPTGNSNPLLIGNRGDDLGSNCRIAYVGVHNIILTQGEIKNAMRRGFIYRGLQFNSIVGHDADLSGNARTPTLTGTAIADSPPVAPPFGVDMGWQGAFGAAAPSGFIPYPNPRYALAGGMQSMGGGIS